MISAGDFRNGVTIEIEGNVCQIVEFQHVKPGKGAAFVRTKYKNIITGAVLEKSFRPTEKFPQARAFYMYMYAHPGKKLNFMGNEIGQLREWDEKREQDWDILKYPIHDAFHHFMQKLNHLYMTTPALSAKDYENAGFHWLDCHQEERCIYAFERTDGKERIAAVFNFSDEDQKGYELPVEDAKELEVILASDDETFGGCKKYTKKKVKVTDGKAVLDLSAYSAVYYSIAV